LVTNRTTFFTTTWERASWDRGNSTVEGAQVCKNERKQVAANQRKITSQVTKPSPGWEGRRVPSHGQKTHHEIAGLSGQQKGRKATKEGVSLR